MYSKMPAYSKKRSISLAIIAAILALFATSLTSCATKLPPIQDDITAAELIQKAQERSDAYDWKGAQYYYKALLEKFSADKALLVTAKYELAFIEYKQGHKDSARAGFLAVLDEYATTDGAGLPKTWKILAEKMLEKLPAPATK